MKATEQFFYLLSSFSFIMLYKEVLTFEFVDKILQCDHLQNKVTVQFFHLLDSGTKY